MGEGCCESCRFYQPLEPERADGYGGICRRFPPQLAPAVVWPDGRVRSDDRFVWPEVGFDDFCGEWRAKGGENTVTVPDSENGV